MREFSVYLFVDGVVFKLFFFGDTAHHHSYWGRLGRDRMVVGFTTTYAITVYHH